MTTMTAKFNGKCKACGAFIPAGTIINYARGYGARHVSCDAAKAARAANFAAAPVAAPAPAAPVLDLKSIADFLHAAVARGLKSPKLRVLADGGREMRLNITRKGVEPGSIAVAVAGTFTGCVRMNGEVTAGLARDPALQARLLAVALDPAKAAKDYAALMGRCSFCNLPLTDAGSVEVGYGPVCAAHWGLPHAPKGTPALQAIPEALQAMAAKAANDMAAATVLVGKTYLSPAGVTGVPLALTAAGVTVQFSGLNFCFTREVSLADFAAYTLAPSEVPDEGDAADVAA